MFGCVRRFADDVCKLRREAGVCVVLAPARSPAQRAYLFRRGKGADDVIAHALKLSRKFSQKIETRSYLGRKGEVRHYEATTNQTLLHGYTRKSASRKPSTLPWAVVKDLANVLRQDIFAQRQCARLTLRSHMHEHIQKPMYQFAPSALIALRLP